MRTHPATLNADNLPSFEKFGRTILPSEGDPTHTMTLRGQMVRQVRARWKQVIQAVNLSIVQGDVFGLNALNQIEPLPHRALAGFPASEQLRLFMEQLQRWEAQTILQDVPVKWIEPFIGTAFDKGILRGNRELRQLRPPRLRVVSNAEAAELLPVLGSFQEVQGVTAESQVAEMRALSVEKTWLGLSGVTQQVNTQVAQIVAQGLASRQTPRDIAAGITDRIEKIGITRSEMIARTEIVAANNRGAVAEYARAERIIGEPVLVQWEATLDQRLRPAHRARHGKVFTQEGGLALINEPSCRCALLPYIESIEGKADQSSASQFKDLKTGQAVDPGKG